MVPEKEEIKGKLKKLKEIGITREEVAIFFEYTPGYLNQLLGEGGKLPPNFITKFDQFFEDRMKPAPVTVTVPALVRSKAEPIDTLYIQRKDQSGFNDYVRRMEAAEYYHEVEGDAMHPLIKKGDGLLLIEIDRGLIVGGEVYVAELKNGLTVVRYIKFDEADAHKLQLVSYNKSAGDTAVNRSDLRRLFKIVLKISK